MPDALSLSRSDIPEEIKKAIEAFEAEHDHRAKGYLDADAWCEAAKVCQQTREALTAAILSRLGEADRKTAWLDWMLTRIAFDSDGTARQASDGHDWPALAREALEVRDPVLMPAITAERDAALARVERLEKALEDLQGAFHEDSDAYAKIDAALSSPAPTEEG